MTKRILAGLLAVGLLAAGVGYVRAGNKESRACRERAKVISATLNSPEVKTKLVFGADDSLAKYDQDLAACISDDSSNADEYTALYKTVSLYESNDFMRYFNTHHDALKDFALWEQAEAAKGGQ